MGLFLVIFQMFLKMRFLAKLANTRDPYQFTTDTDMLTSAISPERQNISFDGIVETVLVCASYSILQDAIML